MMKNVFIKYKIKKNINKKNDIKTGVILMDAGGRSNCSYLFVRGRLPQPLRLLPPLVARRPAQLRSWPLASCARGGEY